MISYLEKCDRSLSLGTAKCQVDRPLSAKILRRKAERIFIYGGALPVPHVDLHTRCLVGILGRFHEVHPSNDEILLGARSCTEYMRSRGEEVIGVAKRVKSTIITINLSYLDSLQQQ